MAAVATRLLSDGRWRFVLASRSPRRSELLRLVIPNALVEVVPPRDAVEPGFEGLHDLPAIERRLLEIARGKADDVWAQVSGGKHAASADRNHRVIIAADTIIVAHERESVRLQALGQPPADETWRGVVGEWFRKYYRTPHLAVTGLCLLTEPHRRIERAVSTRVSFRADSERWLDWYLDTGESRGKAGGYAIQGAGSIFVEQVEGSISNVVGLPLEALLESLDELDQQAFHA